MVIPPVAKHSVSSVMAGRSGFYKWLAKLNYTYGWSGRKYGLHYHDACYEPAPEVQEALRRYRLADPYGYDLRQQRILRAHNLAMNSVYLPKEEWTKFDEDSWYLHSILSDIEREKLERTRTSGLKTGFNMKPQI